MKIRITASNIRDARITLKTFKESSNFELIARSYQLSTAGIEHESLQINRVNGVSKNTSTQVDIEGEPGYCFAPFSLTCYTNSMVSGGGPGRCSTLSSPGGQHKSISSLNYCCP